SVAASFSVTATSATEIYTLSLHDALPIFDVGRADAVTVCGVGADRLRPAPVAVEHDADVLGQAVARKGAHHPRLVRRIERTPDRSEEHTSELQSRENLVCRLLLEKKNKHR